MRLKWMISLAMVCFLAAMAWGQTDSRPAGMANSGADTSRSVKHPAAATVDRGGEGELIELEEVQIHGEIAQPNVTITVSRAKPVFREITLERTPAEGLNDLDLSGLKEGPPKPEKVKNWKEMLDRQRR